MIDARSLIPSHDILLITLDTLRYDVAQEAWQAGETPNLAKVLPLGGWEKRHSPASFTYAAHHAFFAGFLPTPATPGPHPRLFAARFEGSETVVPETCVVDAPDIVSGLADMGYHTICVGGVGFFNKQTPLGCVLPNLFRESHWAPELGVADSRSTENQVDLAAQILAKLSRQQRVFFFLNVSALHQPNCIFTLGATRDSRQTQRAALGYVDSCLPRLFTSLQKRGKVFTIICSDHGTAYGEDGHTGHRHGHPVVWTVPYGEFILPEIDA